jgi:hypothetical protein
MDIARSIIKHALEKLTDDERAEVIAPFAAEQPRSKTSTLLSYQIEELLARHGGHMTKAAAAIGCSTRTLETRMRKLGMPPQKPGRKQPQIIRRTPVRDPTYFEMRDLVLDFFKGDNLLAALWWRTPNSLLGNIKPDDMVIIGREDKLLAFVKNQLEDNLGPHGELPPGSE